MLVVTSADSDGLGESGNSRFWGCIHTNAPVPCIRGTQMGLSWTSAAALMTKPWAWASASSALRFKRWEFLSSLARRASGSHTLLFFAH